MEEAQGWQPFLAPMQTHGDIIWVKGGQAHMIAIEIGCSYRNYGFNRGPHDAVGINLKLPLVQQAPGDGAPLLLLQEIMPMADLGQDLVRGHGVQRPRDIAAEHIAGKERLPQEVWHFVLIASAVFELRQISLCDDQRNKQVAMRVLGQCVCLRALEERLHYAPKSVRLERLMERMAPEDRVPADWDACGLQLHLEHFRKTARHRKLILAKAVELVLEASVPGCSPAEIVFFIRQLPDESLAHGLEHLAGDDIGSSIGDLHRLWFRVTRRDLELYTALKLLLELVLNQHLNVVVTSSSSESSNHAES